MHNYLLRTMLRGDESATTARLHAELALVRRSLAPSADPGGADEPQADRRVTVVTYPAGTSPEDVARQVARQLREA